MPDLRKFRLNSDYPMDKIVLLWEGVIIPPDYILEFEHSFGEPVLCFGVWDTNSEFSSPRSLTSMQSDVYGGSVAVWSDSNKIYVRNGVFDTTTFESPEAYFRVYAVLPATSISDATPTSSEAEKFVFNSDYNYLPLVTSLETTFNTTYTHNLGYNPLVLAWIDYEGNGEYVQPEDSSVLLGGYNEYGVLVDDTSVRYFASQGMATSYPNAKVYMRIYA